MLTGIMETMVFLTSGNQVQYSNFFVTSPTTIKIAFSSCGLTDQEIKQMVVNALKNMIPTITTSSVNPLERLGCSKKRGVLAAEEVIVSLIGTESIASQDMSFQFQTSYSQTAANPPVSSAYNSIAQSSASSVSDIAAVSAVSITAAALLTTGAIAGIVVASAAVGLAAVGAGVYVGVKKMKENKESDTVIEVKEIEPEVEPEVQEPVPEPEPKKYKPKGATIDIFNLDPNDPRSITARAQPINS